MFKLVVDEDTNANEIARICFEKEMTDEVYVTISDLVLLLFREVLKYSDGRLFLENGISRINMSSFLCDEREDIIEKLERDANMHMPDEKRLVAILSITESLEIYYSIGLIP